MDQLIETGGGVIGLYRASHPFAKLTVNKYTLEFQMSMTGTLIFRREDIVSIKPIKQLLKRGLKITHSIPEYSEKVIFWTFEEPDRLMRKIEATGFLSNTDPLPADLAEEITKKQKQGGSPLRKHVYIGAVILWNLLFLYDIAGFLTGKSRLPLGHGVQAALSLLIISAILLLTAEPFRKLVLKEGRSVDEVRKTALFIIILTPVMLVALSMVMHVVTTRQ